MKDAKPKISIIVPVYNVERYLSKCLEGLINQSLRDIEIVCVDDASTDDSIQVLNDYARRDHRIKILKHDSNRGLFQARRTGFVNSTGEYIQHVDSDDWLDKETCQLVYDAIKKNDCELCHIGTLLWEGEKIIESDNEYWNVYNKKISSENLLKMIFCDEIAHGAVTIIGSRSVVKKAYDCMGKLPAIVSLEDMIYTINLGLCAKNCICLPIRLYNYRLNIGTGSRGKKSASHFVSVLNDAQNAFRAVEDALHKFNVSNEYDKYLTIKKKRHLEDQRVFDWNNLSKKEKSRAIVLLHESGYLFDWLNILYARGHFDVVKMLDGVSFEKEKGMIFNRSIALYINRLRNGGREKVVQLLANGLIKRGWSVIVFTNESGGSSDFDLHSDIKRYVMPENDKDVINYILSKLHENNVNLFASHNWYCEKELLLMACLRLKGINVVFSDHNGFRYSLFVDGSSETLNRMLVCGNLINGITSLSRLDVIVWRHFLPNVAYLPNPVEFVKSVHNSEKFSKNIIWIGRLENIKRPADAIRAFSIVHAKDPDAHLYIVGAEDDNTLGHYYQTLEKLAQKLQCEGSITFTGYLNNVEIYLNKASVHWMTSIYEGFPMAWLEAKSNGIPTIVYDMPYVELNGKGTVVVQQGDYEAMARETIRFFSEEDRLMKYSIDACDDMRERFNAYKILDRWEDYYYEIGSTGESSYSHERFVDLEFKKTSHFKECMKRFSESLLGNSQNICDNGNNFQLLEEEVRIMKSSKFWQLRNYYLYIKDGFVFLIFSPRMFLKKYLRRFL